MSTASPFTAPLPQVPFTVPVKVMTVEERDKLLLQWKSAKDVLDAAKDEEMRLRKELVASSGMFDSNKQSGTQTFQLGNGWAVKAIKKINYNIETGDNLATAINEISALGEVSKYKAEKLVKFTPELSLTTYKELTAEEKAIIDRVLTTSPGSPSLELVPPKS